MLDFFRILQRLVNKRTTLFGQITTLKSFWGSILLIKDLLFWLNRWQTSILPSKSSRHVMVYNLFFKTKISYVFFPEKKNLLALTILHSNNELSRPPVELILQKERKKAFCVNFAKNLSPCIFVCQGWVISLSQNVCSIGVKNFCNKFRTV